MVNSIILFILTHMLSRRRFQRSHSNHIRGYTNIDLSKSLGRTILTSGGGRGAARGARRATRGLAGAGAPRVRAAPPSAPRPAPQSAPSPALRPAQPSAPPPAPRPLSPLCCWPLHYKATAQVLRNKCLVDSNDNGRRSERVASMIGLEPHISLCGIAKNAT